MNVVQDREYGIIEINENLFQGTVEYALILLENKTGCTQMLIMEACLQHWNCMSQNPRGCLHYEAECVAIMGNKAGAVCAR